MFSKLPKGRRGRLSFPRFLTLLTAAGLLVAIGFSAGFFVAQNKLQDTGIPLRFPSPFSSRVEFSLIEDVWTELHAKYFEKDALDDTQLIYGAVRGMVETIEDPYTIFLDPEENENFLESVNGRFEGIGAEIGIQDKELTIIAPLKNTPAERAGLRAKDVILKIDDKDTAPMSLEEAVSRIRGERGTQVILLIVRKGVADPFEVSIVRDTIFVPSLQWEIKEGNIAVISLYHFTERAPVDFQRAAEEILRSGAQGIVLDLRNNPGGYLNASIDIAGWFLPEEKVVLLEDFGDGKVKEYKTAGPASLQNFPLVVLINGGSASAAEILAGALRDHRNIPLVGEKTFGKGTVQELEELSGGASLKYTIAQWRTPSGRSIQNEGIEPTVFLSLEDLEDTTDDLQLLEAIEVLKELL